RAEGVEESAAWRHRGQRSPPGDHGAPVEHQRLLMLPPYPPAARRGWLLARAAGGVALHARRAQRHVTVDRRGPEPEPPKCPEPETEDGATDRRQGGV